MQAKIRKISGTIERITYQNPENGYTVARLQPEGSGQLPKLDEGLLTVVGTLPVSAGEAVEVEGYWKHHPRHGWQLVVVSYRTLLPATEAGLRRYLGSGLIRGVGPVTARKIVDHFGLRTLQILEEEPERLREVRDVGPRKAELIAHAWEEQRAIKEVMIALSGYGVSTSLAVRIFKEYGQESARVVREEPYRLAREVWGIGFRTADKIARQAGVSSDDPRRVRAGVLFALEEAGEGEGHTCLPEPLLVRRASQLLEVEEAQVAEALESLVLERALRVETVVEEGGERVEAHEGSTPGLAAVPGERVVWLPVHYASERSIASSIRRLSQVPEAEDRLSDMQALTVERLVPWLQRTSGISLTREQAQGVVRAIRCPVSVLTGGPGVGKTTTQRALVSLLARAGKRVVLSAPTGKAAKRLGEVTGAEAKTLHRLLGLQPGGRPTHDLDNPLHADLVIADEVSMLDTFLAHQLLRAVGVGTHLLLVGDPDQLPSVGPGNVLGDLTGSGVVPVTRLTKVFRQAEGSALIQNAHRVNRGLLPEWGGGDRGLLRVPRRGSREGGGARGGPGSEAHPEEVRCVGPERTGALAYEVGQMRH